MSYQTNSFSLRRFSTEAMSDGEWAHFPTQCSKFLHNIRGCLTLSTVFIDLFRHLEFFAGSFSCKVFWSTGESSWTTKSWFPLALWSRKKLFLCLDKNEMLNKLCKQPCIHRVLSLFSFMHELLNR